MARDQIPDSERRDFVAVVRDETGATLYIAKLELMGTWLVKASVASD